jgi:eukaryotic-like serine/threonine-protein kinase
MLTDRANVLGKYRLIAEIAHGGMGIVYLAMAQGPRGFHKLVVVKELKPELIEEPAFLTMFLDEARLAARLSHPNIVQTNEVGNDGDRYFLAMEYLDGRGLDHIRRRAKGAGFGLSSAMHLRVIADMLAGLDYAHKLSDFDGTPLQIVHRDVSPQNVFVTFSGHVKLLDFGIAKAASSSHETHAGVLKGKVSYMSPEQARGMKVDARADVFSAGVMLWEALTGRRLRGGKNDRETLTALVTADLPRASSVKPSVPPELDEICARAMAWDRDERYQSAGAMQDDLESYLAAACPSVTSREVGDCVSEMFREDRVRTSALVEAHVAQIRSGAVSHQVPVIDVGSPRGSTPADRQGTARSYSIADGEDPPSAPSGNISVASPSGPSLGGITGALARHPRRKPLFIAGGAAAATLLFVGVFMMLSSDDAPATAARLVREPSAPAAAAQVPLQPPVEAAPPVHAPAAAPVPPGVTTTPERQLVSVEIRVSPAFATLQIDDAELNSNPFVGRYRSDEAVHHVRASARGYITKTVAITFDANVKLDLSLEHAQPPPVANTGRPATRSIPQARAASPIDTPRPSEPAPAEQAPAPAAKPAPTEVNPTGGNKPQRAIDPTNPYGGAP